MGGHEEEASGSRGSGAMHRPARRGCTRCLLVGGRRVAGFPAFLLAAACIALLPGEAQGRLINRVISECVPAFVCMETWGATMMDKQSDLHRPKKSSADLRRAQSWERDMATAGTERMLAKATMYGKGEPIMDRLASVIESVASTVTFGPDFSIQDAIQTGDASPWCTTRPPTAADLVAVGHELRSRSGKRTSRKHRQGGGKGQNRRSESATKGRAGALASPHWLCTAGDIKPSSKDHHHHASSQHSSQHSSSQHSSHSDSSSDAPACAVCGEEVRGIWIMGFDQIHCSAKCREMTEQAVLDGRVPDFAGVARMWNAKEEEELRAKREREDGLRRLQREAQARELQREYDQAMRWDLPASGTASGARYAYCP